MYVCFSLTGDLPFVRSGRQGCMCVYVCFSLTGDLSFVRSGRQGIMCVYVCFSLTGDLPFVRSGRHGCMCVYVCFSLTGDLPFVRSGRQGCMCVYVCFSLTGDLPFVRSGRQGCMCIYMCFINYNRHFIYTVYFHRSIEEADLLRHNRKEDNNTALIKKLSIEVTMRDGKLRDVALKKRWRERSMKNHDLKMADVEDEKRNDEEKMLRLSELKQAKENERAKHYHAIDAIDHCYNTIIRNDAVQDHFDTYHSYWIQL